VLNSSCPELLLAYLFLDIYRLPIDGDRSPFIVEIDVGFLALVFPSPDSAACEFIWELFMGCRHRGGGVERKLLSLLDNVMLNMFHKGAVH
jgi:hypothetical protein